MQLLKKKQAADQVDGRQLLMQLREAKMALDGARRKFEYVTEPDMVASCIYEMHAEQARYDHLLGKIRAQGICADRGSAVKRSRWLHEE